MGRPCAFERAGLRTSAMTDWLNIGIFVCMPVCALLADVLDRSCKLILDGHDTVLSAPERRTLSGQQPEKNTAQY